MCVLLPDLRCRRPGVAQLLPKLLAPIAATIIAAIALAHAVWLLLPTLLPGPAHNQQQ
jgi:hypothetical protein